MCVFYDFLPHVTALRSVCEKNLYDIKYCVNTRSYYSIWSLDYGCYHPLISLPVFRLLPSTTHPIYSYRSNLPKSTRLSLWALLPTVPSRAEPIVPGKPDVQWAEPRWSVLSNNHDLFPSQRENENEWLEFPQLARFPPAPMLVFPP